MARRNTGSDSQFGKFCLKDNVMEDISALFLKEEFSDVTIIVDSKRFPSHKLILAARSKHFKALLSGNWEESNKSEFELLDLSAETFHLLLRFIYTGELEVTNIKLESIFDVFQAVNKYGFEELEPYLINHLEMLVDSSNVLKISEIASRFSLESLIERCNIYIANHTLAIVKSSTFVELPMHLLKNLFQRDALSIMELSIFLAAAEWIQHNKETADSVEFEGVLSLIRLPLISVGELENVVRSNNLFREDAILEAIKTRKDNNYGDTSFRAPEPIREEDVADSKHGSGLCIENQVLLGGNYSTPPYYKNWIPTGSRIDIDITNTYQNNKIWIKLGSVFIVNCIKIEHKLKSKANSFKYLEFSCDGCKWLPVYNFQTVTFHNSYMICFPATSTKYLRITCAIDFRFPPCVGCVKCMYSDKKI